MEFKLVSHLEPSMINPCTYEPSRDGPSSSSGVFFVTSVVTTTRSKGHSFLRACDCITAVRNDCGLKKPQIHTTLGITNSPAQSANYFTRSRKLSTHPARGLIE